MITQERDNYKLVNKEGIAEVLGVSLQKLDLMLKNNEIPYIKLGKLYRFHIPSVIQGLIESHSGGLKLKQDVKVILG
jgi:excisionase family DNA binding protein